MPKPSQILTAFVLCLTARLVYLVVFTSATIFSTSAHALSFFGDPDLRMSTVDKLKTVSVDFKPVDYKTQRLRDMSKMWKGTVLEERTVPLLAMLVIENGALAEHVRGDHGYAIGLEQNHICNRGFTASDFPTKTYCGKGAVERFAKDLKGTRWENYLTDWRVQFQHYTEVVTELTNKGYSVNDIIKSWNSREAGRRNKVKRQELFVSKAISPVL